MPGAWAVLLPFLTLTTAAPPEETPARPRLSVIDKGLTRAVTRAVQDAQAKLAGAQCQQVLLDFQDASGRTLRANLDRLEQTAPGYLGWMVFYNGSRQPFCRDPHVHAFTEPGSRIVYICERQFREKVQRDAGLAAAYVIHELLHSLGLGENPPSAADITRQVVARCGR